MIAEAAIPLVGVVIDFLTSNRMILYGTILFAIAIGLEIINGLLDIAVYTAVIGGIILLGYGGFLYIT